MKVGDIYFANLSPAIDNEIGGVRLCKIIKIYYGDLVRVQPQVLNPTTMEYEFSEMHERTISRKRLKEFTKNPWQITSRVL